MKVNKLPDGDWVLVRTSGAALRLTKAERAELLELLKEESKENTDNEPLYHENL